MRRTRLILRKGFFLFLSLVFLSCFLSIPTTSGAVSNIVPYIYKLKTQL